MEKDMELKQEKYEIFLSKLVNIPGVYAILIDNRVVYIGKSKSIRRRARDHFRNAYKENVREKYDLLRAALKNNEHRVCCVVIEEDSVENIGQIENYYLNKLYLPLNTALSRNSPIPKNIEVDNLNNEIMECSEMQSVINKSFPEQP